MFNLNLISKLIIRTGIISFGHYILSNGIHSPYYLDFTLLANKPKYLDKLIDRCIEYLKDKDLLNKKDKYTGILDKGVVIAIPLAVKTRKSFSLFSIKLKRLSVGTLDVNENILLIDDMLSTGRTIDRVINYIREIYKVNVKDVFVVLDREEGGYEMLRRKGINVYRLVTIRRIAKILKEYDGISDEEYEIIENHVKEIRSQIQ